jgi:urease accessory protein
MTVPFLLLSDGRFPAGSYAHSGGLEPAVEDGLAVEDLPLFIAGRLRGPAFAECLLAVAAARSGRVGELAALLALDLEAEARCPSPPLRSSSRRLGAQLLRTAIAVWPEAALLSAYRERSGTTPRPVAFGVVAAVAGLSDVETAEAYLYEDAMTVATAAVRILPVDAARTIRWLVEARGLVERLAREAEASDEPPHELPAGFAPALELRSLAHAAREGRLFAS